MGLTARAVAAGLAVLACMGAATAEPRHGLSTFGELKYPPDFKNFEYVNPAAPKGGAMRTIGVSGLKTFDSFNGFVLKGDAAEGTGYLFDTLMARALDEPDAVYGLIAESADVAADRHSVTFKLRPEAQFSDGTPVTAEDLVFSLVTMKEKGHPQYSLLLKNVAGVEALDPLSVRYTFTGDLVRDLPIIVAQLPVLSKAYYTAHAFEMSLEPPLGSGPYKIADFKPSTFVNYQRRTDYWARDLAVNRGLYNFDTVRIEYFRDRTAELQNLLNGTYDFREESVSKDWATAYTDAVPIKDGRMLRLTVPDERPSGTQGFFINTRKAKFSDVRLRHALDLAFDFEWTNKNLFYGLYKRTTSYFENSDMKAMGPPSPEELALLQPYQDNLPPGVLGDPYTPPVTDGSGSDERKWLREAGLLLDAAGWTVKDGVRFNAAGEPLEVEILEHEESFDRIINPYIARLQKIGVKATIRRVDGAQYEQRTKTFDFDVTVKRYALQQVPGVELRNFFGTNAASVDGSFNLAGIKDPVVDAMIDKVMAATSRAELLAATRALDRVMRAGHYWVPHWYLGGHNLAFWDRFSRPAIKPKYDRGAPDTWWYDSVKAAATAAKGN